MSNDFPLDPGVRVGHVHLKVSDLDRSIQFYEQALGFELQQRMGSSAAFLSAGGYHHHVGLNTWTSKNGPAPARNATGLYHVAFLYPTKAALGRAFLRLQAHGVPLIGASDHGVSLALYLEDPDGNGIELYWDRPENEWPRQPDGTLQMVSEALDFGDLLAGQRL